MAEGYKPPDYTSVSPYLIVDGADGTIAFLASVFAAVELRRIPRPDGRVMHAEVRIDDSILMLADSTAEWPPISANVHVYVPDVDATYRKALAAGGTSLQEPAQKEDEDKRGGIRDPGGTSWWIATRVGMP